jgi:hypothetical protein
MVITAPLTKILPEELLQAQVLYATGQVVALPVNQT